MNQYRMGQRWVSASEPELGLGTVVQVAKGRVHLLYPATGEVRQYVSDLAPLQRVQLRTGQEIEDHEGTKRLVETIREEDGVITYCGSGWEMPEAQLNDNISLDGPEERLNGGHFDEAYISDLRIKAIEIMHSFRKSPTRGFLGGRIDLIPHQIYIAQEICNRSAPRVLLSDEVGLGKTIEAGLIIHRRRLTGRAERVLIIVPESLVHQWFVEMLRKFNLWMNIFDEERCLAIETTNPNANPFLDDQLALCSIDFLANNPLRAKQAFEAEWDLMTVDEAHHLGWNIDHVSPEYEIVETLANKAEGVLLLTATPEQLGPESHFARLRLLDPNRYSNLSSFLEENQNYADVAPIATSLHEGRSLTNEQRSLLAAMPDIEARKMNEEDLLSALLDRHGPGRVVFRNTRSNMSGFPKRIAHLSPLDSPEKNLPDYNDQDEEELEAWCYEEEEEEQNEKSGSFTPDQRVLWMEKLLEEIGEDKVLLICENIENAKAIGQAIDERIPVKSTLFHEELTLVQRDRNAAWFEEKGGARIMICSEIGSEGRNFQFTHHLVLFDLPVNPEVLAQRIGRLDRIGQTQTINIYVPYTKNGPEEVLARWYHEGLDAFEHHLDGGNLLLRQFGNEVSELLATYNQSEEEEEKLAKLITKSSERRKIIAEQLEKGRDRLLELNSYRPKVADKLIKAIHETDNSMELETFLLEVFEHFGVRVEERDHRTYLLDGRSAVNCDGFPGLPKGGLVGTFDRSYSLGREDITLLTGDHPIVTGAVDLLLGSERGNCSFHIWEHEEKKSLLLEGIFVLEAPAPKQLHVDRFLPPTPLRFLINQEREVVTIELPEMTEGSPYDLMDDFKIGKELIPAMLGKARKIASATAKEIAKEASRAMMATIQGELDRLAALRKINENIRQEEIDLTHKQMQELAEALSKARIRLDTVRLIFKGPLINEYSDSIE